MVDHLDLVPLCPMRVIEIHPILIVIIIMMGIQSRDHCHLLHHHHHRRHPIRIEINLVQKRQVLRGERGMLMMIHRMLLLRLREGTVKIIIIITQMVIIMQKRME